MTLWTEAEFSWRQTPLPIRRILNRDWLETFYYRELAG